MITISQSPAVQASLSETTHMAQGAEAVQVSLNSFRALVSKKVQEQGADEHGPQEKHGGAHSSSLVI